MINKFVFVFLLITILLGTFSVVIISHEATHYFLGETSSGICFGNCSIGENKIGFGATYNIQKTSLGYSEPLAYGVCGVAGGLFFLAWNYILFIKRGT